MGYPGDVFESLLSSLPVVLLVPFRTRIQVSLFLRSRDHGLPRVACWGPEEIPKCCPFPSIFLRSLTASPHILLL